MRILIGCDMTFAFTQPTPMIVILNVHASRVADLESPDALVTTPVVPIEGYHDGFGNWCNRLVAPAGSIELKTSAVIRDEGLWDARDPDAREVEVGHLPADTLVFLLGSRYCETDRLTQTAWDLLAADRPAPPVFRRSATTSMTTSPSATNIPGRRGPPRRRLQKASAFVATTRISPSPSAAA